MQSLRPSAAIYGCAGERLTAEEKQFFARANPFGFILFARNCVSPEQVKALTQEMRDITGREQLAILIDQEGGRVARLRPPHWRSTPAAAELAKLAAHDREAAKRAVYLNARLIAEELRTLGITVDCAPLADIPVEGSHEIIGDRAYGADASQVASLAAEMARGLVDGGVLPVLKHIPGHGRATVDSHEALPIVTDALATLEASDFKPFHALRGLPFGMTAHIIYHALDENLPATLSKKVIRYIREEIGFDGMLMSDDLSMKALQGELSSLAKASLDAGCDLVLHCNGNMQEMTQVADGVSSLNDESLRRANAAWAQHKTSSLLASAEAELSALLARAA